MLVCTTCGCRWDDDAPASAAFEAGACPLCGGEPIALHDAPPDDATPVHADVGRTLREHLLDVGA